VRPEVAVINPEIVGVAVMAVGLMVRVVPLFPREVPVELVIPSWRAPTESMTVLPEVAVVIVRFPEVFVQPDAPPEATVRIPVEFPRLVAAVPVELIAAVPPETVIPAEPVKSPAEVMVPVDVVEMFPVVVTLSPVFVGERVVPVRDQYPMAPDVGAVDVRFFEPSV
jgi:hypothetical protein